MPRPKKADIYEPTPDRIAKMAAEFKQQRVRQMAALRNTDRDAKQRNMKVDRVDIMNRIRKQRRI